MTSTAITAITAHSALLSAGFFGRCNVADIKRAGLITQLYAAADAGLARYDGHINVGPTGTICFFYIFLGE